MYSHQYATRPVPPFEDELLNKSSVVNENNFIFSFSVYETSSRLAFSRRSYSARYLPPNSKIWFFRIDIEIENAEKQQLSFSLIECSYEDAELAARLIFSRLIEKVEKRIDDVTLFDKIHLPSIKKFADESVADMIHAATVVSGSRNISLHFQWEPMFDQKIKLDPKIFNF